MQLCKNNCTPLGLQLNYSMSMSTVCHNYITIYIVAVHPRRLPSVPLNSDSVLADSL